MKNLIPIILLLFLTACGIDKESPPPLSSVANTGELDTTFNTTGYIAYNGSAGGSSNDEIFAMTIDSQGRVIAVGSSTNVGGDRDMAVWRLTSEGALDSSFSGNGIFTHDSAAGGGGNDMAYAVAVSSSDEIFVTGTSLNGGGNFDMVVWKLTTSGALDSTFSGTGVFVHDSAAGGGVHDQGNAIGIDSTGKVVVGGFSDQTVTNRDMAVWRLTTSGTLDTTFSGDGIFTDDGSAGGEDEEINALVIDSANTIILVGRADSAASLGDMAIWKLDGSGVPDTSFNASGFFSHNDAAGGDGFDSATGITIDANGKYYVSGYSRNADGNNDMVLWKVNLNGTLDTTFSADGMVVFDVSNVVGGGVDDTGESVLIDSEGRIVVVGAGDDNMYIWRFDEEGNLDENFNQDGFFSHDSAAGGFSIDAGTCVVEDSLDRLYIGGFSENASGDFDATFWRLK